MLSLDVTDTGENTNFRMYTLWMITYMLGLFFPISFLALGLFYAESDERKSFVSVSLSNLTVGLPLLYGIQGDSAVFRSLLLLHIPNLQGVEQHAPTSPGAHMQHSRQLGQ